jgi:hypothetical protein
MRAIFLRVLAGVIFFLICIDLLARAFGVLDFPLYENNKTLGYVPAPNQHGSFLRKNDWAFNELSMGTTKPFVPQGSPRNILLIGDSIVLGGNPMPQELKLGPLLNDKCPQVWPISAGSWSFNNEVRYLQLHADILHNFNRIVFILNSEDFGSASKWASEITHPTYRPLSSIYYLARKYFGHADEGLVDNDPDWRIGFEWLLENYGGSLTVILYASKREVLDQKARADLDKHVTELASNRVLVTKIADDPSWTTDYYRDDIHPNSNGEIVLANILLRSIPECN